MPSPGQGGLRPPGQEPHAPWHGWAPGPRVPHRASQGSGFLFPENRCPDTQARARTRAPQARLLHYYAMSGGNGADDWCAWHADHGTLTGLCSAMFLDEDGAADCRAGAQPQTVEAGSAPRQSGADPGAAPVGAGLRVLRPDGAVQGVRIPADGLAFQLGETAQVMSGGALRATRHCVAGPAGATTLSRETFAVFMQPRCAAGAASWGVPGFLAGEACCTAVPRLHQRFPGAGAHASACTHARACTRQGNRCLAPCLWRRPRSAPTPGADVPPHLPGGANP